MSGVHGRESLTKVGHPCCLLSEWIQNWRAQRERRTVWVVRVICFARSLCFVFFFFFFFLWLKKSFIYQRTKNQTIETSSQRTRVKSATSTPCPVSMLKVTVAKQKTKWNSPTLEPIKQVSVVWHHFQAVIESSVLWWEYYLQFTKQNRKKKKKKESTKEFDKRVLKIVLETSDLT